MNRRNLNLSLLLACGAAALPAAAFNAAAPKIAWAKDWPSASRDAAGKDGLVLMEFYADWCGPCRQMETKTLADPAIVALSRKFTSVRVDIDKEAALARRFKVQAIPFVVVATPDGKVLKSAVGFQSVAGMKELMQRSLELEN